MSDDKPACYRNKINNNSPSAPGFAKGAVCQGGVMDVHVYERDGETGEIGSESRTEDINQVLRVKI